MDVLRTYAKQAYLTPVWERILTTAGQLAEPRRSEAKHIHKAQQRLSPAQVQEAIKAYLSPMSAQDVAEQFGLSKASVLRLLRREGIPIRPKGATLRGHRPR